MRAIFIIGFLLTLVLAFTACDDEGTTPTAGNTPAHVLRSLIYAFNNRDAEMLDRALSDGFAFHFDPSDIGDEVGGYTIPDSWGRDDHLTACGNMFEQAYSLDFDVGYELVGDPDEGANEFTAYEVQIRLLIMVDPVNGFLAQGFCDFRLIDENPEGTAFWVITDWWDNTALDGTFELAVEHSFGSILAMYR
jgi:hypothetical protein